MAEFKVTQLKNGSLATFSEHVTAGGGPFEGLWDRCSGEQCMGPRPNFAPEKYTAHSILDELSSLVL